MTFTEDRLPRLYRSALKVTRRRGEFTLGRLNHKMFPNGQYFRMDSGNRFFVPGDRHFFGYMTGHELHIVRMIDELVRPGDACFDVGANIGYFASQMAAICGAGGIVVAYEPDDENFAWLERNATLARKTGCNIQAVKAAVSDRAGKRQIIHGAESTHHMTRDVEDNATDSSVIASVSLDEEVERLKVDGPVRMIKVDVQGHEPAVMRGMECMVRDGRLRHAILEINPGEAAVSMAEVLKTWEPHIKEIRCFMHGEWRCCSVTEATHTSDALVSFN